MNILRQFFAKRIEAVATKEYKVQVTKTTWYTVRSPRVNTPSHAKEVVRDYVSPIQWDTELTILSEKNI